MMLNERDPNDKTPFPSIEHDLTVEQRKETNEMVVSAKEEQRNQPEGVAFSDLCEGATGHHEDCQDRHKNWEVGYLGKELEASFKVEYDVTGRAQCRQCKKMNKKETLMATYKAVMRPALEYASSVWSPIASSTSIINKLQVMQNAALRTAIGCTQDTNIQHLHDETLTLPIHKHLQLHASQYKQKTQHPSHPLHKHTTYFNTPRLKKTLFLTMAATQQTCAIYIHILSLGI